MKEWVANNKNVYHQNETNETRLLSFWNQNDMDNHGKDSALIGGYFPESRNGSLSSKWIQSYNI